VEEVMSQAAALKNPPMSQADLFATLHRNGLVRSVARLKALER
jgi:hypothetical protein